MVGVLESHNRLGRLNLSLGADSGPTTQGTEMMVRLRVVQAENIM